MKKKNTRIVSKEVNTIFESKDYHKLCFTKENRVINPHKVKRLTKSMMEIGFINAPIKVNTDYEIIDGQHRWLASQKANVPFLYFIDRSGMSKFDNMVSTNSLGSPWTKQDSINGLAIKGFAHYIHLRDFQKEFPDFSMTEHLMLMNNSTTANPKDKFERGEWKHKDVAKARIWANGLLSLKPYFRAYNKSLFVRAMIDTMARHPEFSLDEFIHKVKLRPGSIYINGDVLSYKVMIENIYNYKRKNNDKLNLRF